MGSYYAMKVKQMPTSSRFFTWPSAVEPSVWAGWEWAHFKPPRRVLSTFPFVKLNVFLFLSKVNNVLSWVGYLLGVCKREDFPGGSDGKESACNAGNLGLIPGLGRSPEEENGNLLQYSCLRNPMDRRAWWATVHSVAKSQTRLSDWHVDFDFNLEVRI